MYKVGPYKVIRRFLSNFSQFLLRNYPDRTPRTNASINEVTSRGVDYPNLGHSDFLATGCSPKNVSTLLSFTSRPT